MSELLDENEAGELLGVTGSTMERWRRVGTGPAWIKISGTVGRTGGRVRYRRADIEAFVQSRRVQPEPSAAMPEDVPLPGLTDGEIVGGINGGDVRLEPT